MAADDTWGISNTGFYRPRADEVRDVTDQRWKETFGADRDTSSDTIDGHFVDFVAEHLDKLWDAAEASYRATFVGTSAGVQLHELGTPIVGAPKAEKQTTVSWVAYGDDTTVVPVATQVVHDTTNEAFASDTAATIGTGDTTFAIGITPPASDPTLYRVTINGTDFDYNTVGGETGRDIAVGLVIVIAAGAEPVTADVAGSLMTLDDDAGGSMTVVVFDDDTGTRMVLFDAVRIAATAINAGATSVSSESAWTISNPVTGLTAILNPDSGVTGQSDETDPAYRTRIRNSTEYGGVAALVLDVDGVTFARAYENDTDVVDAEGRPAHSVETVVLGGEVADIAQAIWDARLEGIQTFGTSSSTATDANGDSHTVNFARPTDIPIYVDAVVTQGEEWPATGDPIADINAAIVVYLDGLGVGQDVTPAGIFTAAKAAVSQVADLVIQIDDSPAPAISGVFAISLRQIASSGGVTVA